MLEKLFVRLEVISDAVNILAKVLLVAAMLAMVFSTGLQVVFRYVSGSALTWPEEVNVFLMTWITFVGSSIALKQSEHIGIDLFVDMLPAVAACYLRLLVHLLMLVMVWIFIDYGFKLACMNWNVVSDALEISMFFPRMSLVVGGAMMFVQLVYILCLDVRNCAQQHRGGAA